jgi:hypothetical protein
MLSRRSGPVKLASDDQARRDSQVPLDRIGFRPHRVDGNLDIFPSKATSTG